MGAPDRIRTCAPASGGRIRGRRSALAINGSPEFTGLRVTVSVGPDRPLARLVCTGCVPMKIKFVVVTLSRSKAPTSVLKTPKAGNRRASQHPHSASSMAHSRRHGRASVRNRLRCSERRLTGASGTATCVMHRRLVRRFV